MELQQLRYFRQIAELENITEAAKILLVSQPSLSNLIARLEKELEVPLFYRKGRNIKLTSYGHILYNYAVAITGDIEDLKKDIHRQSIDTQHRIRMASPNSIYLNRWLSDFLVRHSEYRLNHTLLRENMMAEQLYSGDLDVALTTRRLPSDRFDQAHLEQTEYVLLVPKSHRFSAKEAIHFSEARYEDFLALSASEHYSRLIDDIAETAGFQARVIFEGETSILEKLCAGGAGVFLHLKSALDTVDMSCIHQLALKDAFAKVDLYLTWKKNRKMTPACQAFKDFVIGWHENQQKEEPPADG